MASSDDKATVVVRRNDERHRYEGFVGAELAGVVEYHTAPGRLVLVHTEVDDAFEGKGVGSQLAVQTLDDVRAQGLQVTPECPFIRSYIERHPGYADLVAAES